MLVSRTSGRQQERSIRAVEAICGCLIAAGYLYFAASGVLAEFGGDNAVYWLTANHHSPWGDPHPQAAAIAASSKYPPLYPLALGLLGGGTSLLAAHLVSVTMLCCGFLALRACYLALGLGRTAALALVGVFCVLQVTRFLALDLYSEHLYLLLELLAVTAVLRERESVPLAQLLLIGILIGAAILTRTIGITLLCALGIQVLRTRRAALLIPLGIATLLLGYNALHQASSGRYVAELLAQYRHNGPTAVVLHQLAAVPVEWARTLAGPVDPLLPVVLLSALGLLLVVAAFARARAGKFDGYYVLVYLLVVVVWPYPAEMRRLYAMILPIMLGQAWWMFAPRTARGVPWLAVLVIAPILCFALPDAVRFVGRIAMPVPEGLGPYRRMEAWQSNDANVALWEVGLRQADYAAFAEVERRVPESECVFATKPAVVSLFGRRRTVLPPAPHLDARAFRAEAAASGCRYFLLLTLNSPSYPTPLYPADRLRGELDILSTHLDPYRPDVGPVAVLAKWRRSEP